jgi:hypothetical protein
MIPIKNTNRIETGEGIYKDVQVNLLDIIERGLDDYGHPRFSELGFMDNNPEIINIQQVPAIFAWCDGEDLGSGVMGGSLGRSISNHSTYFATVQYVAGALDQESATDDLLFTASQLRKIVLENLNLNDIANGGGKIIQVDLRPSLLRLNGRVRSMIGFKILIEYIQTSRSPRAIR